MSAGTAAASTSPEPAELPQRGSEVIGTLPAPFAASMVDYLPGSVSWWRDGWLASTTAWGGKSLGHLVDGRWRPLTNDPRWSRRPMVSDDGGRLAAVIQEPEEDGGTFSVLDRDGWSPHRVTDDVDDVRDWDGRDVAAGAGDGHDTALDASGNVIRVADGALVCGPSAGPVWSTRLPPGATVVLVLPSPARDLVLVVVRARSRYQSHVFTTRDGRSAAAHSLHEVVQPVAAWLDDDRIVLSRERWPNLEPIVWSWRTGEVEPVWSSGTIGTVRSVAVAPDGTAVAATGSPAMARTIRLLDDAPEGAPNIRAEIVTSNGQEIPCIVHEPDGAPRGTCLMFPGGPHEPVWGSFAPMADVLTGAGWRVVRVNTRSSGLREDRYRPRGPVRYGVDDLSDAKAVLDGLATGPVVTMGMSYGAYIGSLLTDVSPRAVAAVVLVGFVSPSDVAGTEHAGVRAFARVAFTDTLHTAPRDLRVPHFFAHGALDRRIPVSAIHRYTTPGGRMLTVSTEGHGIHSDVAARTVYPPMFDWIEEITG